MERSLIMLIGASGSGKTTLAKNIAKELENETSVRHISMGNLIRHICHSPEESPYKQALLDHLNGPTPTERIDDEIINGVISRALGETAASLVLLDGAPRTLQQINDIYELAIKDSRDIGGVIATCTLDKNTSVARLLGRNQKPRQFAKILSVDEAIRQVDYTGKATEDVADVLTYNSRILLRFVETSGLETETAAQGMAAVREFLS